MLDGLGAMIEGAIAALVLVLPALAVFWRLTMLLAPGHRALRPAIACLAAYGVMAALGTVWAINAQRPSLVDEAMAGLLAVGALTLFVAFLVLLLFSRKA
jgi:hypothetical protein